MFPLVSDAKVNNSVDTDNIFADKINIELWER